MLLPSLEMGGMERMVSDLARGLAGTGIAVQVICTRIAGPLATDLAAQGVPVALLPISGRGSWFGASNLIAALREARPDVVHTHSGFWWRGAIAGRRAGAPAIVHTVHGLHAHEPWWGPIEKRVAASITEWVVGVSPALARYLNGTCSIPASKVATVPNGVDLSRFGDAEPWPLRERLGLEAGAFVFGTVARLAPVKNLDLGIGALAGLMAHGVDAHFVLAGDGPERTRLEQVASGAGLTSRVHFLGEIAEPNRVLAAFDAFTLTSHAEGTSISLLEAMASGLPCVVTAVGGNPDVVAQGDAGMIIPDDDVPALTGALLLLSQDAAQRTALGARARIRVQSAYSLEAMVSSYLRLYTDALAGHR